MAINFKLFDQKILDPKESWAGRPWQGWAPEAALEEVWEYNRGIWRFGDRIEDERIATFSWRGEVVLVAAITGIEDVGPQFWKNGQRRRALRGFVLPEGHRVSQPYLSMHVQNGVVLEQGGVVGVDAVHELAHQVLVPPVGFELLAQLPGTH